VPSAPSNPGTLLMASSMDALLCPGEDPESRRLCCCSMFCFCTMFTLRTMDDLLLSRLWVGGLGRKGGGEVMCLGKNVFG
jgi:hypothetical protein